MKTVSIPDDIYERAERLARRNKNSLSQLVSDALREYLASRAPDDVVEAMNQACVESGGASDSFVSHIAFRILKKSEW